jgi:hypothetical protein
MASVPHPALILQGDMLYQAETKRCTSVIFLFSWHVIPFVFGLGEGGGVQSSTPPIDLLVSASTVDSPEISAVAILNTCPSKLVTE